MKKSIAIDMDGVIADIESQFIKWYLKKYGVRFTPLQMKGRGEYEVFPEKDAVPSFLSTPGFFSTLPVIDQADKIVKELSLDFDVYIVSAAMEFPHSLNEKYEWLKNHFPFISWKKIIFCGDKCIIDTDYLIDDHCKNLDPFKGIPLMFTAFHNTNYSHHIRMDNWEQVRDYFYPQ